MVLLANPARVGDMPKGEPMPEGLYHLRCDKADVKVAKSEKSKGIQMIEAHFTVFGPDEAEQFHGRKVFENFMLGGEGQFRTRQFLEAAGFPEDFELVDSDQILNAEVAALVQIQKGGPGNDGKVYDDRNRVQRFMPIA